MRLLLSICFIAILTCSVSFKGYAQKDPKAKEILEKVSDKYNKMVSFKIEFTRNLTNNEAGVSDDISGTIYLMDNLFKLEFLSRIVYFDGKYMRNYDPDLQEYTINVPEGEEQELNLSSVLGLYKKGYNYQLSEQDSKGFIIELVPENKDQSFTKISMDISKKYEIRSFTYHEDNGNLVSTIVDKLKELPNAKPSFFDFFQANLTVIDSVDLR